MNHNTNSHEGAAMQGEGWGLSMSVHGSGVSCCLWGSKGGSGHVPAMWCEMGSLKFWSRRGQGQSARPYLFFPKNCENPAPLGPETPPLPWQEHGLVVQVGFIREEGQIGGVGMKGTGQD